MKFKSSLICLLLCNGISMHALKFEKLQPLMKIYSVVPWQQLFNVSVLGALGWFGYDNFQLKKNALPKTDAEKTLEALIEKKGLVTKKDADSSYTTIKYFEETVNANLETTYIKKVKDAMDKTFATQDQLSLVDKRTNACLTDLQEQVNTCSTQEQLMAVENKLNNFALKTDLTKLENEHNELQKQFITLNTSVLELVRQHKEYKEQLLTVIQNTNTIVTELKNLPNALASNKPFIAALAPNVGGHLAAEKFPQPVPQPAETENTKGSDGTNTNG